METMLSKDQIHRINELNDQYEIHASIFPKVKLEVDERYQFPAPHDLQNIARLSRSMELTYPDSKEMHVPKVWLKYLVIRLLNPVLSRLFKRQMIFNDYVWFLANALKQQDLRIKNLEERLAKYENRPH